MCKRAILHHSHAYEAVIVCSFNSYGLCIGNIKLISHVTAESKRYVIYVKEIHQMTNRKSFQVSRTTSKIFFPAHITLCAHIYNIYNNRFICTCNVANTIHVKLFFKMRIICAKWLIHAQKYWLCLLQIFTCFKIK